MTAKQVLEKFINEMKNFEEFWSADLRAYLNDKSAENLSRLSENSGKNNDKILADIINIQNKFLSKKALSLKQDRRLSLSYRVPPEYDQTIVSERKINDKKYEFDVLEDDGEKKIYTLILEHGEWKIDQMAFLYNDKWKKSRQLF